MTVVHPRTHATTNMMTSVKGGRGKEIILKIHLITYVSIPHSS